MTDERRVEVAAEALRASLWATLCDHEESDPYDAAGPNGGLVIVPTDTVRALCDAADEVERLRADRDALREQVQRLRASRESNRGGWARTLVERDALRAAVDRVRALGERDGRDRLAAWLASNGVEQADTVAVEAAAFVLAALESGNYGTPEWFSSIDKPLFPLEAESSCPACERDDAADEVERLRAEVSLARRIIDLDMRLHAPSASTAGCGGGIGGQMMTPHCPDYCEHPKHDADKALREDLLRDFYRLARTPLPERDASRTAHAGVVVIRCPECDAGEPCQLVPYPYASAPPETGDGAEGAPSPMRDEPAPSPDDPHGACSRALVGMAVERDKAQSASAASERAYRETRAIADDNLRRLLDCREVVRSLTAERDASRTAHAALAADLRALRSRSGYVLAADVLSLLDRHAPTTGATP